MQARMFMIFPLKPLLSTIKSWCSLMFPMLPTLKALKILHFPQVFPTAPGGPQGNAQHLPGPAGHLRPGPGAEEEPQQLQWSRRSCGRRNEVTWEGESWGLGVGLGTQGWQKRGPGSVKATHTQGLYRIYMDIQGWQWYSLRKFPSSNTAGWKIDHKDQWCS